MNNIKELKVINEEGINIYSSTLCLFNQQESSLSQIDMQEIQRGLKSLQKGIFF